MKVNVESDPGRDRAPEFPYVNPLITDNTDYNPNREYIMKRLDKGYHEMHKKEKRKNLVPDPEFDDPCNFY